MCDFKAFYHPSYGEIFVAEADGERWYLLDGVKTVLGYDKDTVGLEAALDVLRAQEGENVKEVPLPSPLCVRQGDLAVSWLGLTTLVFRSGALNRKEFLAWLEAHQEAPGTYLDFTSTLRDMDAEPPRYASLIAENRMLWQLCLVRHPNDAYLRYLYGDPFVCQGLRQLAKDYGVSSGRMEEMLREKGLLEEEGQGYTRGRLLQIRAALDIDASGLTVSKKTTFSSVAGRRSFFQDIQETKQGERIFFYDPAYGEISFMRIGNALWFPLSCVVSALGYRSQEDALCALRQEDPVIYRDIFRDIRFQTLDGFHYVPAVTFQGLIRLARLNADPWAEGFLRLLKHRIQYSSQGYYEGCAGACQTLAYQRAVNKDLEEERDALWQLVLSGGSGNECYLKAIVRCREQRTMDDLAQDYGVTAKELSEVLEQGGVMRRDGVYSRADILWLYRRMSTKGIVPVLDRSLAG